MKIAAVTDDEFTISQYFGRAAYYWVVTVETGVIVSQEKREKMGHAHFSGETYGKGQSETRHGFDPAAQNRHARMLDAIQDCDVLLARGMGAGAYESIRQAGIKPFVTDVETIDIAIQQYLAGILTDHVERLH
jgi:predicted Fe-Mo cluster-binding NifX family protein